MTAEVCGTGLARLLSVAVCAVLAGARSLAAIGEWAADAPAEVLTALGVVHVRGVARGGFAGLAG